MPGGLKRARMTDEWPFPLPLTPKERVALKLIKAGQKALADNNAYDI